MRFRHAALVVASAALITQPAIAQNENPESAKATGSLNLPIDTGSPAPPSSRSSNGIRRSVAASSRTSGRAGGGPLSSRNGIRSLRQQPVPAPKVLAQLGYVVIEQAVLRVSVDESSRALSRVPRGSYVAVVAQSGDYWGVLMMDHTIGWTPKASLEMMDYQTQVPVPGDPNGVEPPTDGADYTGGDGLDPRIQGVLREAFTYLGVPYVWGGNTRNGLDCSAFVRSCFRTQGIDLPRHSGDQIVQGRAIYSGSDLRPGDRLYFDCSTRHPGIDHTGIYLGKGLFIHASGGHGQVVVESLLKPLYVKGLVAIRRDFGP